ncbi:MAG: DUF1801 domain-containing protein [Bacteroidia bacterium]|jgi:hypothetical protein|nr:DUF1801 domain-containing protein [Bacteroidia bacterium]
MASVADYIANAPAAERHILMALHDYLCSLPGVTVKMSYGTPFYYRNSWICYTGLVKEGGVELAFTRANELSNEQGLLDFRNRKQVAGVIISDVRNIPWETVREVVQEALILDDTVKYNVRKKSR